MGNMRAKKVREKILAVLLAVTVVVGFVGGQVMQVMAEGRNSAYVDTSDYEQVDAL